MEHCCEMMRSNAEKECTDGCKCRFECPDCLISFNDKSGEYGIIIHDGTHSYIKITHCPWCGSRLNGEGTNLNEATKKY